MKVGIYLRVSTDKQSTEMQKVELQDYLKRFHWFEPTWYEDVGVSGTTENRPELKRMMEDAKLRKIETIIVWKLDRLFRSMRHMVNTLHQLSEWKVGFLSLRDNIDMTTSAGKLMVHMISAFAEFEKNLLVERINAGLENARRKGVKLGAPQKANIEKIREMRSKDMSLGAIAKKMGLGKSTIARNLKKNAL